MLKMLGYVVDMLEIPLLSDRAEKAFSKCCKENSAMVLKHIDKIYNLLTKYPNKLGLLSGMAEVLKKSPEMLGNVMPTLLQIQV